MIRILLALGLLLPVLAGPAFADKPREAGKHVEEFGGIDDSRDSARIGNSDAINAENVLTDSGFLESIPGMTAIIQEALAGYSVKGLWPYTATDGTKYLLFHSSLTVYQTDFSGAPVAIGTTSASSTLDGVQAFGRFYFVDKIDFGWYWDTVSAVPIAAMPLASKIEFADERLYVADTSISGSQVHVSSYGSHSDWTVPSDVSEPHQIDASNSFTFGRDDGGGNIKCFKDTPWGKFIGKGGSSYILKGSNNYNPAYYKRLVSPNVGCLDDRLVQMVEGELVWAAPDGVYRWKGSGPPELISKKIENRFKAFRQLSANADSRTTSTQLQWEAGTISDNGATPSWDTSTEPGSIFPSSVTFVDTSSSNFSAGTLVNLSTISVSGSVILSSTVFEDNFADGDYTNNPTWTIDSGGWSISGGRVTGTSNDAVDYGHSEVSASSGLWKFTYSFADAYSDNSCGSNVKPCLDYRLIRNASGDYYSIQVWRPASIPYLPKNVRFVKSVASSESILKSFTHNMAANTEYDFQLSMNTSGEFHLYIDSVFKSSVTDTAVSSAVDTQLGLFNFSNIHNYLDDIYFYKYASTGSLTSQIFDTIFSTPIAGVFSSTFTALPGDEGGVLFDVRHSTSPNDDRWTDWVASSTTLTTGATQQYQQYRARFHTNISTKTPQLDVVSFNATSTGVYTNVVQYLGTDMTSWGTGNFDEDVTRAGLITYEVRSDTVSFAADAAAPSWSTHVNNSIIAISTGSYYQFRATSHIDSASQTVKLNRHVVNWEEGESVPGASIVHDRRYFMCVTHGTESVKNNTCEILQQNKEWTRMTGKSIGAMTTYDNEPVAGSGDTDSAVWEIMQDGIYDFAGDPIEWFWVSKDFMLRVPGTDWPVSEKVLNEIWVDVEPHESDISLTVGYSANKSGVYSSSTTYISSSEDYVNRLLPFDEGYALGKYFRFRFSNNQLDDYVRLNAYTVFGEVKKRTQD